MKVRYLFSLIFAFVMVMIAPTAMACSSCHVERGVDTYQAEQYEPVIQSIGGGSSNQVANTGAGGGKVIDIDPTDVKSLTYNGATVPITPYSKPRASEGYAESDNDGKVTDNAVVANKQAKPYAFVVAG